MNYCDDGGACHHNCADRSGKCYRRQCCEPLSNVFPNDEWPPPSGAEVHGTDPTLKPTSTPSITVGTQVRLTGVVSEIDSAATAKHIGVKFGNSEDEPLLWFSAGEVEVIRQPFKRGEVVWPTEGGEYDESWFLVSDEAEGKVLAVATDPEEYQHIVALDVDDYERRP